MPTIQQTIIIKKSNNIFYYRKHNTNDSYISYHIYPAHCMFNHNIPCIMVYIFWIFFHATSNNVFISYNLFRIAVASSLCFNTNARIK